MLSMETRKEITRTYRKRYQRAKTRKQKTALLDEVCEMTGWHRKHAIRVMSSKIEKKESPPDRRGPKPVYGTEHKKVLKLVWTILDFPCSKRLEAGMRDVLDALDRCRRLHLVPKMRSAMLAMSASTMDRMLKTDRASMNLRGRSTTKPGGLLKSQIPVRRGTDWDDAILGFMEIDTVAHCGSSAKGEFAFTLDATDVSSGWSEQRATRNKAATNVFEAMRQIQERMPFSLKGIDSDNESEFINDHFLRYCTSEDLVFTRGRPYTKNDGCHVEEKNWSIVRRVIGYGRYEGQDATDLINAIYDRQRVLTNYFLPSAKLVGRTRDGSRVVRFHDEPATPYRRILKMRGVGAEARARMRAEFKAADPYLLRQEIAGLTRELLKMNVGY